MLCCAHNRLLGIVFHVILAKLEFEERPVELHCTSRCYLECFSILIMQCLVPNSDVYQITLIMSQILTCGFVPFPPIDAHILLFGKLPVPFCLQYCRDTVTYRWSWTILKKTFPVIEHPTGQRGKRI